MDQVLNAFISKDKVIRLIAKTCHNVNKAYCESIGDNSQPEWEQAGDWQQNSAIDGVKYFLKNTEATPEDMHDNWMREKYMAGWKYGPEKNAVAKTHPCLKPYSELPSAQKVKDSFFISVVRSFTGKSH